MILLLFLLAAAMLLLTRATPALPSCSTPVTFSESRLPAILEVENVCTDSDIALCLEFDAAVYPIHILPPSQLHTVSTVLEDCWVIRAATCEGETLLEHTVSGTRKLTIGCTLEASSANAIGSGGSVGLDCSLTVTPRLADVFDAVMEYVPTEMQADIWQDRFLDLNTPMQFVDKLELLKGVYEMCFDLARHGVDTNASFSVFRHARAVVWHTESCHPELVGEQLGFANSHLALYGNAFANMHAQNELAGTWIASPTPLTSTQETARVTLMDYAVGIAVSQPLPNDALPTAVHGVGTARQVVVRMRRAKGGWGKKAVRRVGNVRMGVGVRLSGQELCDGQGGGWTYFKSTKPEKADSELDCCSDACFAFGEVSRFSTRSFLTNCCLACNLNKCSDELTPATRAMLQRAEVQVPTESVTQMEMPITVMI